MPSPSSNWSSSIVTITLLDSVLRIYRKRYALRELPIELSIRPPVAAVTLRNRTLGPTVQLFLQCARELAARSV
jgi:hypothetical protein